MTTRIGSTGPDPNVGVQSTAHRTTPRPARPFQALMESSGRAVVAGAEAAASKLPGGPVLVAAVRDGSGQTSNGPIVGTGMGGSGGVATSPTGTSEPASNGANTLEGALARQTEDSMYYLQLQQRIQAETRNYQAVSNVLKARHDSVKNAISNLR